MIKKTPEHIVLLLSRINTASTKSHFTEVIRDYISPTGRFDYVSAGEALGIEPRTIQSYVLGENLPTIVKFLKMCVLFGAEFLNRMLALVEMDGAFSQSAKPITDFELNAATSVVVRVLGKTLIDGKIDERESQEVVKELRAFLPLAQEWLAKNDCPHKSEVTHG